MTNQGIIELARLCARNAFDCEPEERKPAHHAYDFVRQMLAEDADDAVQDGTVEGYDEEKGREAHDREYARLALSDQDWTLFKAVYQSAWTELKEGVTK